MNERARTSVPHSDPLRPVLVCFSHLRWDFVWQRPQHLLTRAARHFRVIVVEEPAFEAIPAPRMTLTQRPGGIEVALPFLPLGTSGTDAVMAQRDLVANLLERETAGAPRIFWYYTPMALAFSSEFDCDLVVYDNMDELSSFRGASPQLLTLERDLLARADLVFTGGMSLYEAKRSRHPAVHLFPSSIEVEHFAQARRGAAPEPSDQAGISHPRLGFFGVIDERLDVELVGAVAALRPVWQIVMIGPVVKINPASLPQRPNIHWLGGKDYKELPRYLAGWDAGLMPFAINEATRFISPTKTPEFLAAGIPVVSTPIVDVVRQYGEQGLVEIAGTASEFVSRAEGLLARPRQAWLARVDRQLAAGSWDKTWDGMHRLMAQALDQTASLHPGAASAVYATPC